MKKRGRRWAQRITTGGPVALRPAGLGQRRDRPFTSGGSSFEPLLGFLRPASACPGLVPVVSLRRGCSGGWPPGSALSVRRPVPGPSDTASQSADSCPVISRGAQQREAAVETRPYLLGPFTCRGNLCGTEPGSLDLGPRLEGRLLSAARGTLAPGPCGCCSKPGQGRRARALQGRGC